MTSFSKIIYVNSWDSFNYTAWAVKINFLFYHQSYIVSYTCSDDYNAFIVKAFFLVLSTVVVSCKFKFLYLIYALKSNSLFGFLTILII